MVPGPARDQGRGHGGRGGDGPADDEWSVMRSRSWKTVRGGWHNEPILGSHGSRRSSSEAGDGGRMQGEDDGMEGRLRWTRSSELCPVSSASPRGTFSACAGVAGAPVGGTALRYDGGQESWTALMKVRMARRTGYAAAAWFFIGVGRGTTPSANSA
jgi:hypothetical protein